MNVKLIEQRPYALPAMFNFLSKTVDLEILIIMFKQKNIKIIQSLSKLIHVTVNTINSTAKVFAYLF